MERRIIDTHTHIYPEKLAAKAVRAIGKFYDLEMEGGGTSEGLIESGRKIGVERYIVHSAATTPEQVASINNFIAGEVQKHPEFTGLATLHPYMDNANDEYERALSLGLKGIKLHPDFQEFYADEPKAMKMYEVVNGRGVILFHAGDPKREFSSPARIRRVADAFPDMDIIAAHMGGYSRWDEAKKELIGQRVYIDTSSALFALSPEEATEMIHAHGVERVLFGTDYPMWDHKEELERFMRLSLTEAERSMILYENAARLFGLK